MESNPCFSDKQRSEEAAIRRHARQRNRAVDCAGEVAASAVAADAVLDPNRAYGNSV